MEDKDMWIATRLIFFSEKSLEKEVLFLVVGLVYFLESQFSFMPKKTGYGA